MTIDLPGVAALLWPLVDQQRLVSPNATKKELLNAAKKNKSAEIFIVAEKDRKFYFIEQEVRSLSILNIRYSWNGFNNIILKN